MKVAYVYFTYKGRSGTERYSIHLLNELRRVSSKSDINIVEFPIKKVERSVLGLPFGGNTSLLIQSMLRFPRADIVHSTSPEVITPKTNVVTVHDVFPLKYPHMFSQTFIRKLSNKIVFERIKKVERIITVSKSTAKDLVEILDVDKEKIHVIYEGVDFNTFYPDKNVPQELNKERTSLLLVGDLNPRKMYEIVFEAVSQMDDVVVYHIGPRNNWESRWKKIEKIAKKYPNKIKLLGPKSDDELRQWLSNVDFFVFPSIDEGFGLPVLEALACGTNVILSNIPIFREIVGEIAAAYFDLDAEGFIEALERAQKNKKSPEKLIKYVRQFTWNKVAKETIKVYKELLG